MDLIAALFLAGVGLACIYAGYKLFCGLPAMTGPGASRGSVFLLNIVPGALLALIGTGLVATQARAVFARRSAVHRHQPGEEGTASWRHGKSGFIPRGV